MLLTRTSSNIPLLGLSSNNSRNINRRAFERYTTAPCQVWLSREVQRALRFHWPFMCVVTAADPLFITPQKSAHLRGYGADVLKGREKFHSVLYFYRINPMMPMLIAAFYRREGSLRYLATTMVSEENDLLCDHREGCRSRLTTSICTIIHHTTLRSFPIG